MPDTPKHSISVAGVVIDDHDRVLVIQRRDNGHWEPPGGVLEVQETPEAGVRREVLEETGLLVAVDHLSGVYKNLSLAVVALVFRCSPNEGQVTTSSESRAVAWRSLDEVVRDMEPAYAIRVVDAFDNSVSVRSHDGVNLVGSSFPEWAGR